jgi:hypothetical protein
MHAALRGSTNCGYTDGRRSRCDKLRVIPVIGSVRRRQVQILAARPSELGPFEIGARYSMLRKTKERT